MGKTTIVANANRRLILTYTHHLRNASHKKDCIQRLGNLVCTSKIFKMIFWEPIILKFKYVGLYEVTVNKNYKCLRILSK